MLLVALAGLSYLTWKSESGVTHSGWVFGKKLDIRVWANYVGQPAHLHLAESFYHQAHQLEADLWLQKFPDGPLATFNRASQSVAFPVGAVVPETLAALKPVIQATLKMVDPTYQPLAEAFWPTDRKDENAREPASPPRSEVERMRDWLGIDKVNWTTDPPRITKLHPNVYLDFAPWHSAIISEALEATATQEKATAIEVFTDGMLHVWKRRPIDAGPLSQSVLKRLELQQYPKASGAFAWLDFVQTPRGHSPSSHFQIVEPRKLEPSHSDVSAAAAFCRRPSFAATWARAAVSLGSVHALALANKHRVPLRVRTTDGKFKYSEEWEKLANEGAAYPAEGEVDCLSRI